MTDKRTKISNWVYRISLSLLVLATLRYGQFMYDQLQPVMTTDGGAVYWSAVAGLMSGPMGFVATTLAMLMRSGAVVWLLGLQFILIFATIVPSLMSAQDDGLLIIGIALAIVVFLIGVAIFTYLIRKTEIRQP